MIPNEYRQIYFCEFSHSKTYPSLSLIAAERKDAAVGAFMIRKNKKTGKETKRAVACYQCMRKSEPERFYDTKVKNVFMSFTH